MLLLHVRLKRLRVYKSLVAQAARPELPVFSLLGKTQRFRHKLLCCSCCCRSRHRRFPTQADGTTTAADRRCMPSPSSSSSSASASASPFSSPSTSQSCASPSARATRPRPLPAAC
ncbi:unnamed protein product [Closterium sp. NIES-54]